jgi:3-deoxy-7-phosphoheptulonate synthase
MGHSTEDLRIESIREVTLPAGLHAELPVGEAAADTVHRARTEIQDILHGRDDRLLVIMGPCSIHDPAAALDYASRLRELREQYARDLAIVMRVYFEKPRTTVGWKGLINDPDLDGSFAIDKGLHVARKLLLDLNAMGAPAGVEFLDIITPQYVADLVSWGAIGARTTESQVHREVASGLSCPVGFKNGTAGSVQIAVDAIRAAKHSHVFLSLTQAGQAAIFSTTGNEDAHLILRGGKSAPNYDAESVDSAARRLEGADLSSRLMIDFSHANSKKQHERQMEVSADVARRIGEGDRRIMGVMVESNLVAGNQKLQPGQALVYGQSITDACLGWEDSEKVAEQLAQAARARRQALATAS